MTGLIGKLEGLSDEALLGADSHGRQWARCITNKMSDLRKVYIPKANTEVSQQKHGAAYEAFEKHQKRMLAARDRYCGAVAVDTGVTDDGIKTEE